MKMKEDCKASWDHLRAIVKHDNNIVLKTRLDSKGLESQTAGLQSLWLASWFKSWLRTVDGLWWLVAAMDTKQENRSN